MQDDYGISDLPKFKKISAVIPIPLFDELTSRGLLNSDWDRWLGEAILAKLREKNSMED